MTMEPYLTSDEMLLLQQIDPKYQTRLSRENAQHEAIVQADYAQQVRKGIVDVVGVVPSTKNNVPLVNGVFDPATMEDASEVSGGFAFGALLPILGPMMPTLVDLAVKGVSSAVKAIRGKGVMPPNARGVFAPNLRTMGHGARKAFFKRHISHMMDDENMIRQYRGKRFWHHLLGKAQDYTAKALRESGVSPKGSGALAQAAISRLIPKSFINFIQRTAARDPSDKPSVSHLRSIIRPLCEWVIHKALGNRVNPSRVRELVDQNLAYLDSKYAVEGSGVKEFWRKAKKIMKKVGNAVIPVLAKIGKEKVPVVLKNIISKIGMKDSNKRWLNMLNSAADALGSVIPAFDDGPVFKDDPESESEPASESKGAASESKGSGRRSKGAGVSPHYCRGLTSELTGAASGKGRTKRGSAVRDGKKVTFHMKVF